MVGTLPVAPVQLPIFRSRTYIRFTHLDSSLKFFPDYTRVLQEFNAKGQSWVATENCVITGTISQLSNDIGGGQIFVDGALVAVSYISKPDIQTGTTVFALVKKGQTITTRSEYGAYSVKAYGLD